MQLECRPANIQTITVSRKFVKGFRSSRTLLAMRPVGVEVSVRASAPPIGPHDPPRPQKGCVIARGSYIDPEARAVAENCLEFYPCCQYIVVSADTAFCQTSSSQLLRSGDINLLHSSRVATDTSLIQEVSPHWSSAFGNSRDSLRSEAQNGYIFETALN